MRIEELRERLREKAIREIDAKTIFLYRDLSKLVEGSTSNNLLTGCSPTYVGKLDDSVAVFEEGPLCGMTAFLEQCTGCGGDGLRALLSLYEPGIAATIAGTITEIKERLEQSGLDFTGDLIFKKPYQFGPELTGESLSSLINFQSLYKAIQSSEKEELVVLNTSGPGPSPEIIRQELKKWDNPEFREMPLDQVLKILDKEDRGCRLYAPLLMIVKYRVGFETVTYVTGCEKKDRNIFSV